jgi:hypothetical protein
MMFGGTLKRNIGITAVVLGASVVAMAGGNRVLQAVCDSLAQNIVKMASVYLMETRRDTESILRSMEYIEELDGNPRFNWVVDDAKAAIRSQNYRKSAIVSLYTPIAFSVLPSISSDVAVSTQIYRALSLKESDIAETICNFICGPLTEEVENSDSLRTAAQLVYELSSLDARRIRRVKVLKEILGRVGPVHLMKQGLSREDFLKEFDALRAARSLRGSGAALWRIEQRQAGLAEAGIDKATFEIYRVLQMRSVHNPEMLPIYKKAAMRVLGL